MSNFRNAHVVAGVVQLETAATDAAFLEKEFISCPRNATDISLLKPDNEFDRFSDSDLVRAVELLVSPDDLTIRGVAEAILRTLSFTAQEVAEHLSSGERLNDGAYFDLTNTTKAEYIA